MPRAMPSTMPMVGANDGTPTAAAARPTRLELTANPPIAMASGSPAAERDIQPVALGCLRGGQQLLGVFFRHVVGVDDIEIDARGEGPAVRRDGAVGGIGILDGRYMRHAFQLTE